MRSGWGEVDYPQVVGHEIVGTVVKAGKDVEGIKVDINPVSSQRILSHPSLRLGTWSVSVPRATLAASATHANSIRSHIVMRV